ncbi:MAG: DUF445 family protein [Firmicutes bacterium]|nr:DUF445 family protein [Bacillota bacterium]
MEIILLLLFPLAGALVGWGTNLLAVRLLFRPLHPRRIPVVNLVIQGLLPRRQEELARSVASAVEEKLLSTKELLSGIHDPETIGKLASVLSNSLLDRLAQRLNFVPWPIRDRLLDALESPIRREIEERVAEGMVLASRTLEERFQVRKLVEERLLSFSLVELEQLVQEVSGRELRQIVLLGAYLGATVGLIQAGIWFLLRRAAG